MFSKELENLIQATLEDGVLEEYEKAALAKRAQAEGVDLTELEIYINSILQKRKRELAQAEDAKQAVIDQKKKEAFGRVCPNCGKQVPSLNLNCECGYEFMKDCHESSVQLLSDKISKLQEKYSGTKDDDKKNLNEAIIDTIAMFSVPNTKEDIIDFLALAAPNSKMKGGMWGTIPGRIKLIAGVAVIVFVICVVLGGTGSTNNGHVLGVSEKFKMIEDTINIGRSLGGVGWGGLIVFFIVLYGGLICFDGNQEIILENKRAAAWRAKFDQVMMKARSLHVDAEFTQMLDYYEKYVGK